MTLPAILFLEDHPDHLDLQALFSGSVDEEGWVSHLVTEIRTSGAIQNAMDEARGFVRRVNNAIRSIPAGKGLKALIEVAEYVVDREK